MESSTPHDYEASPGQPRASDQTELSLDAIRAILLAKERQQIDELEAENEALSAQINALQAELEATHTAHITKIQALQAEIARLESALATEKQDVIPRVTHAISHIISDQNRSQPLEMAEAMGPIMADSTRVQIRESRQDMVDVLHPIIGETIQKAISEFARELQRNIDARLRATLRGTGALRTLVARLRGVSPAELALRDALPYRVEEIFLVQHNTGLLMAHAGRSAASDSDLIGGMLTAIRDFAHDSFGQGESREELEEIQYGEQRIIIQSGAAAYVAVVLTGIEPEGFRARLRNFVSELHVNHIRALRAYDGDPETIAALPPLVEQLLVDLMHGATPSEGLSRGQKLFLLAGGLIGVLFLAFACFYLQFTLALLPVAFPGPSATPTPTAVAPTNTPTATVTPSATPTAVNTSTPTSTSTPSPTATATATASPTVQPTSTVDLLTAVTNVPVWMRSAPANEAALTRVIPEGTAVRLLAFSDPWIEVTWETPEGPQRGWVARQWLDLRGPIPDAIITPLP